MILSKSFGYALRAILYIAMVDEGNSKVRLDEIAGELGVPRYFLAKVMKNLVKAGVIASQKGPYGGFYVNELTMETPLFSLMEITGEVEEYGNCVLRFRKCNAENPCPMHVQVESLKKQWQQLLSSTTIGDLLNRQAPDFLRSIAVI